MAISFVMFLIDICVCLPLAILLIFISCRVVQSEQVPIIYYLNLLITTLTQLCIMIALVANPAQKEINSISISFYAFSMMANLSFKICIALERSSLIVCRLLDCMRTKCSMVVCVVIWIFCIVTVSLAANKYFLVSIFALLPAPLFILFLAVTLKFLPAATSVPAEEKRRIIGALVLLFLNYFLMIFPMIILCIHMASYKSDEHSLDVVATLFLLSPFVDVILFVFMQPIDKLLACFCCCIRAADASTR